MDQRGVSSQIVYLSPVQYKLFDFLRRNSSDHHGAPTLLEIQKGVGFSGPAETRQALNSLRKVEGIDVFTHIERIGTVKHPHYFLSPETLEATVKSQTGLVEGNLRKNNYSGLYIAEPGFGTKAYDEHSMLGLRLFLEANGLNREIQEVVFQGGVIPHLPPYATKANLTALKFLGWIPRKAGEPKTISERLLEERVEQIDDPYLDDFYPKHVNNETRRKIRDLADAFEVAGREVSILMKSLSEDAQLRIQHGEEDRKNIGHIVDATIANWADQKKAKLASDQKVYATRIDSIDFGLERNEFLSRVYRNTDLSQELARKPGEKVKAHGERVSDKLRQFAGEEFWDADGRGDVLGKEVSKYTRWASSGKKTPEQYLALIQKRIERIEKQDSEARRTKEDLEIRLKELSMAVTWTDQLLESNRAFVTRFTRQYPINSDEAEVAWNLAKNLYTRNYFRWDVLQQIHPHPSARKTVIVDTGVIDIPRGVSVKAEVEVENITHGEKNLL
jgi:hypothetical protein